MGTLIAIGVVLVVVIAAGAIISNHYRRQRLLEKYGDENLVDMLMQGKFWQGQTEEMLRDSLGAPLKVDRKVLKTKRKEIWKYDETAKNRYALKLTLENGLVVGWDKKG